MSIETVEYRGYEIKIGIDWFEVNPREDDNLGTMICFHRNYKLGDENINDYTVEDIRKIENSKDYVSLPLYLYDHSGITMNTTGFTCRFDSGRIGLIFVSKERIREEYGWKNLTSKRVKQIEGYLKGEVELYNCCISGQVYCYDIEKDGEDIGQSCGGFLGYDHEKSGLIECAEETIDNILHEQEKIETEEKNNNGVQLELNLV